MRCHLLMSILLTCTACRKANGQESQLTLALIHKETQPVRDSLAALFSPYRDSLEKVADPQAKDAWQKRLDTLDQLYKQNDKKELELEFAFIAAHPASPLDLDIMLHKLHRQVAMDRCETFERLYDHLNETLKESKKGKQLKEELAHFRNSRIGNPAPDFTLKDINGCALSLHAYKNKKYLFIDFWASWCMPCRDDFPFLKALYKKYRLRDFEIIGISTDSNADHWKRAVQKDGVGIWRQASTRLNTNSVISDYFISAIPVKILVDKDGMIIRRWRGGGEENQSDLEKTLEEMLK